MEENQFVNAFKERILSYWEDDIEIGELLEDDILKYANANPEKFKRDFNEIKYDFDLSAFEIVLEALAKDGNNWGQFYIDILEDILKKAIEPNPKENYLYFLSQFVLIDYDNADFAQSLADKLAKELDSENEKLRLATIDTLVPLLNNRTVRNKSIHIDRVQQILLNGNRKERLMAFSTLKTDELLPEGYSQPFKDKVLKFIFGQPSVF